MNRLAAIFLFILINLNHLNLIDRIISYLGNDKKTELTSKYVLEEESETSKETKKEKKNNVEEEKYLQQQFFVCHTIYTSGHIEYDSRPFEFESISYKEALIQPPDFLS